MSKPNTARRLVGIRAEDLRSQFVLLLLMILGLLVTIVSWIEWGF